MSYEITDANGKQRIQFFYRTPDGFLFQTIEDTLEQAEKVKDAWYRQYHRRRIRHLFGR